MPKKLSEAQIQQYRDDGFLFPVPVLSLDEAAECRRRFEALHHMNEDNRDGTMVLFMKPHLVFPWLDKLVRHPSLLDAVEDLIGPDILLYSDSFIVKEPHTHGVFSMHQDRWRWQLEPMEMVNCWLAFSHSNSSNGCMKMVPRSHLSGELPHDEIKSTANVISYGQTVTCIDTSNPVDLVLNPGEMSMHDVGTVHASGPNGTEEQRIGFIMRFIPPHVRQFGGPKNSATLVRGEDRFGHWDHEPRPHTELDPNVLPLHRDILARHAEYGYQFL